VSSAIGRVFFAQGVAQAKNGDELFCGKRNFVQPMGSINFGPSMYAQGALLFPLLSFWWGEGGRVFFFIFPWSQCVLIYVPLSSQWVLISSPICSPSSQCVPEHVLHSTSLLSHMLWQMLSSLLVIIFSSDTQHKSQGFLNKRTGQLLSVLGGSLLFQRTTGSG
jgi:hypothetical protein